MESSDIYIVVRDIACQLQRVLHAMGTWNIPWDVKL